MEEAAIDPLKIEPSVSIVPNPGGRWTRVKLTDRLGRKEAALFLSWLGHPISARTLDRMAGDRSKLYRRRKGPPFTKFASGGTHGRVYYVVADLVAWAKKNMRRVE